MRTQTIRICRICRIWRPRRSSTAEKSIGICFGKSFCYPPVTSCNNVIKWSIADGKASFCTKSNFINNIYCYKFIRGVMGPQCACMNKMVRSLRHRNMEIHFNLACLLFFLARLIVAGCRESWSYAHFSNKFMNGVESNEAESKRTHRNIPRSLPFHRRLSLLTAINSTTRWEKSFPFLFVFTQLNFECIYISLCTFIHILIFVCACAGSYCNCCCYYLALT